MVNGLGVKNLAEVSREFNISLIHISTDYIFSGESSRPYVEDDTPNPKNIYGESKLEGEIAMRDIAPDNSIIIRTSWLYSKYGKNFVNSMLRLGEEQKSLNIIFDQIGSPTNCENFS